MGCADDASLCSQFAHNERHLSERLRHAILAKGEAQRRLYQIERVRNAAGEDERVEIEGVLNACETAPEPFAHGLKRVEASPPPGPRIFGDLLDSRHIVPTERLEHALEGRRARIGLETAVAPAAAMGRAFAPIDVDVPYLTGKAIRPGIELPPENESAAHPGPKSDHEKRREPRSVPTEVLAESRRSRVIFHCDGTTKALAQTNAEIDASKSRNVRQPPTAAFRIHLSWNRDADALGCWIEAADRAGDGVQDVISAPRRGGRFREGTNDPSTLYNSRFDPCSAKINADHPRTYLLGAVACQDSFP